MNSMDGKAWAVSRRTGERMRVPVHWLADPLFSQRYEPVVPAAEMPTGTSSHAQIDAFAAEHGIDLGGAKTRAEKVAVIEAAVVEDEPEPDPDSTDPEPTDTDGNPSSDETPPGGGQE